MNSEILVRPACAEDKNQVVAFCQNTFHWGDYIADVWESWLADAQGQMNVAIVDDRPVGLAHTQILEGGVGWMEGMRVHPDYRRSGVSTAMDHAGHEFARSRGCHLARLATSEKNLAAQSTVAQQGYQLIARFNEWSAQPASGDLARIANDSDLEIMHAHWRDFPMRASGKVLLPNRDWRWTYLTRARLHAQIQTGDVRVLDHGWMFLLPFDEGDWHSLTIHALVGDAETITALALAARAEAAYRGYSHLEAMLADDDILNVAVERAGWTRDSGMLIYEQIL